MQSALFWVWTLVSESNHHNGTMLADNKSKVGDRSQGRPEGFLFISYNTIVKGRALLLSLDYSTLTLIRTL